MPAPCAVRFRFVRALSAAAVVTVLAAGCAGSAGSSDGAGTADGTGASASGTASAAADGAASDGTATGTAEAPGASGPSAPASPSGAEKLPVTPPAQPMELADPCTYEGAYLVRPGEPTSPALPERGGHSLQVSLLGVTADGGADLEATSGERTTPIETAHVGDTIAAGEWTLSVTSVCADQVEFDLID